MTDEYETSLNIDRRSAELFSDKYLEGRRRVTQEDFMRAKESEFLLMNPQYAKIKYSGGARTWFDLKLENFSGAEGNYGVLDLTLAWKNALNLFESSQLADVERV